MKIKVTCCGDCIFRTSDWDPDNLGHDTLDSCSLLRSKSDINYFISTYDSWDLDENSTFHSSLNSVLNNCPLKNGEITISLD